MTITRQQWISDGTQVLYIFNFPSTDYLTDVFVEIDDVITPQDDPNYPWTFANTNTVEFATAPPVGTKIEIYRDTNVDDLDHVFYPGSSIRAKDLNDNFNQLLFSEQETLETIRDEIDESTIRVDQLRAEDIITEAEQNAGEATSDGKLFTSQAAATRFDTFVQEATPLRTDYEVGKSWLQNDKNFTYSVWDGDSWVTVASGGSFTSQPTVIYVDSVNGDDEFDGHRIINPMRTIKAAVAQANTVVTQITSNVIAATYDQITGVARFTTDIPHGVFIGTEVTFTDQIWDCDDGSATFPEANDPKRFVSDRISDKVFEVQMELSTKKHTYNRTATVDAGGGTVTGQPGFLGDGWIIECAPGVYEEQAPIEIRARNLSIVGASIRSTFIHPSKATETKSMFLVDSGFYLSNFTIAGLKASGIRGGSGSVDPDPTYGLPQTQAWVAEFRQGAIIRKSPYIQNCTNFADSEIDNVNFDPNNLQGEGGDLTSAPAGGGMLIDGAAVDPNSPLRSFVVDSFTQIALNGPGVLAKNNGYAQLVSFFGTFCWYHAKSMSGGQLNLSNCTTDFGQYGLVADGKSDSPIFTAAVVSAYPEGQEVIEFNSFTRGSLWEAPRTMTPADHMVVEIGGVLYPIIRAVSATEVLIFRPKSDDTSTPEAFENGGLLSPVNQGTTARFYLQSYISTGGHTFEYTGSGTDYRAHPDFGGVPKNENQTKELGGVGGGRLGYVNGGRVWQSSTDENGKFQVGETLVVDQKTGVIKPLFDASVQTDLIVKNPGIDLRGYKIYQDKQASDNNPIQLEPKGTGEIILGTPDFNSDGERVKPAPIMAPIMENIPDGFKGINQADLNRSSPVLTQNDVGYDADEIPLSGLLGQLAFTDTPSSIGTTTLPPEPNEIKFELSGSNLIVKVGKPDGTFFTNTIPLTQ